MLDLERQYDDYMKQFDGPSFRPSAIAVTNPINPADVAAFVYTSPSSVQQFPQQTFKEGKVDDQGTPLVFDDATGMYFPATNRATRAPVKPSEGAQAAQFVMVDGKPTLVSPGMNPSPTPTPTPTPSAASTAPMAAGAFETNMPVPVSAPAASSAMGMGALAAAPAPAAAAPAPAVFSPAQYKQRTGRDIAPGDYVDANGRPFTVR